MTILSLLATLKEKDVKLELVDNNLKIDAPRGVLTPELISCLKESKQEIIDFLRQDIPGQAAYESIAPAEKRDYYPLSPAQKRLYFIYRMDKESTAYNMPMSVPMPPDFDIIHHKEEFENAVKQLIRRHESLRTSFIETGGEPVQVIHEFEDLTFQIEYYKVDDFQAGRFFGPFDLSTPPLLRVGIVTLPGNSYYFLVNLHHILADGTSVTLLFNDFKALYQGNSLPGLHLQYKDYALWQEKIGDSQKMQRQETYWLERFYGDIPILDLPTEFARPPVQDFNGDHIYFQLSSDKTQLLNKLAQAQGVTPYMVLLTVCYTWLGKLSGSEDIVIGSPTAGRPHHELQDIIGMFVDTLALRDFPLLHKTFTGFLKEVKENTLAAFQNQDYPLEDLVEHVIKERDASRNPLFDVMFVFQNIEKPSFDIPGLMMTENSLENKTAKFDLNLEAMEEKGQLVFSLEYRTSLFNEETARRFCEYYKNIVHAVIDDPGMMLGHIPIMGQVEKEKILEMASGPTETIDLNETIHGWFEKIAAGQPDKTALVLNHSRITYSRLNGSANHLANLLRDRGIRPGKVIGLMVKRSFEMVAGMLGIMKAGCAYLPIDPGYPQERIDYMLKDSGATILLTDDKKEIIVNGQLSMVNCQLLINAPQAPLHHHSAFITQHSNLIYVIYTSGSTGKPKGLILNHQNLVNLITFQHRHTSIDFSKVLQFTTISFDVSFQEIFSTLLAGGELYLIDEETRGNILQLFHFITKNKMKTLFLPVSFLKVIFNDPAYIDFFPRSVTHIITAGEQLVVSRSLSKYLKEHKVYLHNHYGPAETHVITTLTMIPHEDIPEFPTIGKPITNTCIYILDKRQHLQPIGIAGELYAGGLQVGRGYLNNPELTTDRFKRNVISQWSFVNGKFQTDNIPLNLTNDQCPMTNDYFYSTGDLARWLPASGGVIEFLGRIDHQVKIRGIRVEPGEIESQLKKIPALKDAVVMVKQSPNGEKYLCAYIVSEPQTLADPAQIKQALSVSLPAHMVPGYFIPIDKIPLTPSGKVDRKALPEPGLDTGGSYTPPRNRLEHALAKIWSETLGIPEAEIGIDHNFFQLGGHSLKAIVLISKIHHALDVKISLVEIFKNPFIRALAGHIESLTKEPYRPIEAVELKEYYPLSSAQKRLYILNRLEPESIVYNMPAVFELRGTVDIESISAAFKTLIRRHESMRTSFHMLDNEPVQRVHPFETITFAIEDINGEVEAAIEKFIRPFDLSQAPLLRAAALNIAEDKVIFMLDIHHIITDGVSSGLTVKDFRAIYEGKQLTPLRIQYKDYAQWHNNLAGGEVMKRREAYWLNRFSGEIPVLGLPLDFPRPTESQLPGETLTFSTGINNSRRLKEMAASEGASLFMILLALINIILAKMSGQEDIITGTPTAGRRHEDLAPITGMFVNTLALRNYPLDHKTFREFLAETGKNTLDAFENQDYQFEELVDKVLPERNPGRNPLFDVMFALQNMEIVPVTIPGLIVTPYSHSARSAMFDLAFTAVETGADIQFSVEYRSDLFKEDTIKRMISYFLQAVNSVLVSPNLEICAIDILPDHEKKQILVDFNQMQIDYPSQRSIPQLFHDQVKRIPDHVAVVDSSMIITYNELQQRSLVLALQLSGKGVCAGDIVAIMMRRSLEMVIGIIATWQTGAAYLPLDPGHPQERIDYMLKDSNAKVLIINKSEIRNPKSETNSNETNSNDQNKNQYFGTPSVLNFENLNFDIVSCFDIRASNFNSSNPAYIIYTSGTTGQPKGVLIDSTALLNRMHWIVQRYRLDERDIILQSASFIFDVSVCELTRWIPAGARLCLLPPDIEMDPVRIIDFIARQSNTTADMVPAILGLVLDYAQAQDQLQNLSTLRWVFTGVESVGTELVKKFNRTLYRLYNTHLINAYGPTESTVDVTSFDCSDNQENLHIVPIGTPMANVQVYILGRNGLPQPINVYGELCIGGQALARGYLNSPELTTDRFKRNVISQWSFVNGKFQTDNIPLNLTNDQCPMTNDYFYSTGDLARWLAAGPPAGGASGGVIEFLGRIDHQVKIRGYRIELGEIESCLCQHPHIAEAAVIDLESNSNRYLCAYWVPRKPVIEKPNVLELKEFLASRLAPYMIPAFFVQMDHLPRTSAGKINRKLLPPPGIVNIHGETQDNEPQDELEKLIVETWQKVLGIKKIGTLDNFFDLGGNSLKLIQVNQRLNETLGLKIPVVQLFKYPTIRQLREYVQGKTVKLPSLVSKPAGIIKNADIAVIGMAGRFPGAANIHEFWHNLKNSIHAISFFSDSELAESGIDPELLQTPNYVKAAGILEDKDRFDAAFFNYTHGEARVMDPQMRIFHECAWQALEDAAYNPTEYELPVGLYAGAGDNVEWKIRVHLSAGEHVMGAFEIDQLTDSRFIPARVSYKLNLKGPALYIHTACSTSMAAIHTAYHALLAGECAMALAGGVSISGGEKSGYLYQEGMVMSPDGYCRAFDTAANGTVGGEGVAVVVLKPLANAREDGDHIYAVIKASAMNNDGARRVGFSAPSVNGQAEVIAGAYQKAGIDIETVGYIETHGTGTALGDPIEIEALAQAFRTGKKGFCALGSVKSNIGHLDCAAGAVGFIKTILALKHRQIPPTLHFEIPNPQFDLVGSPFYVNTSLIPWVPNHANIPLRAGVSSFGIGGTNIHLILEEWQERQEVAQKGDRQIQAKANENSREQLLILSAKTPSALNKMKQNLWAFLKENPGVNIVEVAYTLQVGRQRYAYQWMSFCSSVSEAVAALELPGAGQIAAGEKGDRQIYDDEKKDGSRRLRRLSLPTYPFEGERSWLKSGFLKIEKQADLQSHLQSRAVAQPVRRQDMNDWFYIPRWTPAPFPPGEKQNDLCLLVLGHTHPLVLRLLERLETLNQGVIITVNISDTFQKVGTHEFLLDPGQEEHYFQLLSHLKQEGLFPQRFIHTWNLGETGTLPETTINAPGFYSLLYLVHALAKQDFGGEISIDVLSSGAQEVLGNELLEPARAAILGSLKVIPQEYPYILCRSIDIQIPGAGSRHEGQLVLYLAQEFLSPVEFVSSASDIAYRNNYRWVKSYEPIHPSRVNSEEPVLKESGVYLITGGIGGIGYTLAQYLVEHYRAKLILTGRSTIPDGQDGDEKRLKLHRLEEAGGKVLYFAADTADKGRMVDVIRQAEANLGPISGVIHAAGVTTGKSIPCPVAETYESECREQFRPKIAGTGVLEEIFAARSLDFILLTSSLSPILGGLGFTAYSAANAFMDAFAHLANRKESSRWLSVGWADWDFTGNNRPNKSNTLGSGAAEFLITPQEGIETFRHILHLLESPASQVVISSGDLNTRIDRWVKLKSLREGTSPPTIASNDAAASFYRERPSLETPYIAPNTLIEQTIAHIWQQQFGFDRIGVQDDFFALGGDSLKAISMISRVHKDLQARVKMEEFFACPNIRALAGYIKHAEKDVYAAVPPGEKREYYPLSAAQKRLYLIDRMDAPGVAYNMTLASVLHGELDPGRLQQAFSALIQRHESLRTSFHIVEDQAVQRVHDLVSFSLEIIQTFPGGFIRPFDLSKAPLLRVGLFKKTEHENILLVDMHHIISDGISLQILEREFAALYSNTSLNPLPLQYKDYAYWQNSAGQQEAIEKQGDFWLKALTGIPILNLPIDYKRPLTRSFAGGAVETTIDIEQLKQLHALVRAEGITFFILLLAAYAIFLAKICGQDDIPVGIPTAGRKHADLERIIGMFVNTLVMRTYPNGEKTFRQFCREVKEHTLQAFENQDYPFEDMVEKIVKGRDTSRNPLFDAAFVLQNQAANESAQTGKIGDRQKNMAGLTIRPLPLERTSSPFDLVFDMVEREDALFISIQYCSQLFHEETIRRFELYYKKILSTIIFDPGIKLSAIEILPDEEKQKLLMHFNDSINRYPTGKTLQSLFSEQAVKTPDHIALVEDGPGCITYCELDEQSIRLAGLLIEKGIRVNDIVGIMMKRSCEMIIGILGILKTGGAYLPINPANPTERTGYMLKDSKTKILLTDNEKKKDNCQCSIVNCQLSMSGCPRRGLQHSDTHHLAYIIYTSGTTGMPKGVPITYANLSPLLNWGFKHLDIGPGDRAIQNLAFYFDWSVWEIFINLASGASLYMVSDELLLNPAACIDFISRNQITVLHVTPTQYSYYVNTGRKLETLKYLCIGAEKLTIDLAQRSFESVNKNCRVFNMYGPTECTIISAILEIKRDDIYNNNFDHLTSIPIGSAVGNTGLIILDKDLQLCAVNIPGELYIAGDGIAKGYLNNPELTADKFMTRGFFEKPPLDPEKLSFKHQSLITTHHSPLYKTGDLARRLSNGDIEYLGRIDNQVKIRGFRIEPGEIEQQLLNHPAVHEAVVIVRKSSDKEKYLCAYVVSEIDAVTLRGYLSRQLPAYMIPTHIISLPGLPLNPNGKVDKEALPGPDQDFAESYSKPTGPWEEKLTITWSEILAVPAEKISRDADFFQLGGHSIKASVLMSRIHRSFNVKISMGDIFTHPTIKELAQYLQGLEKDAFQPLEAVEEKEYYQVSSAQKRLYIQQHMIENNTSYNSPLFTLWKGKPDFNKLENVFKQLIARHENLRTSFHLINEEPVQKTHPASVIEFQVTIHQKEKGLLLRPFDLSQAPLLRVELIKKAEQEFIFMVDMHHIVTDGFSMNILINEFMAIYAGETLPPLKLQYKDYSEWQNRQIGSRHFKNQEEYWLRQFSGDLPMLQMPTDFPRDTLQNFDGELVDFSLDPDFTHRLKLLAAQTGTTLFHILLSVCNIVLSRYSGQEDIVIGTAAVGRNHLDLQGIIGIFVNLLPLRNQPIHHKGFLEFLTEVKENTIAAYDNQDYPFDELVRKLDIQGTGGRTPLLDVAFNFFNLETSRIEMPGLGLKPYQPGGLKSRFDLVFGANDHGETLVLGLTYSSELFTHDTANEIGKHFIQVLEQVLDNNELKLADIKLMTKAANAQSRLKQEEAQFDF